MVIPKKIHASSTEKMPAIRGGGRRNPLSGEGRHVDKSLFKGLHFVKIGTRSVHVGSLSEVSKGTPNYNCTLLSIVTMLNTLHDRYFTGYAQTQANCNAMFDVCKRTFFK